MAYNKGQAKKVYFSGLFFAVAAQYGFNIGGMAELPPLAQCFQIYMLFNVFGYFCGCCTCCIAKETDSTGDIERPLVTSDSGSKGANAKKSATSHERLYYLDNLKVFLTVMVISHHVCCMFAGGGWVWNFNNFTADGYLNVTKQVSSWILTLNQR